MKTQIETTTNRRVYHIINVCDDDPYREEYGYYQKHLRGYRGYWKSRMIYPPEIRMYRTWKHTRKHQWK
jgi:hypothetical protein